MLNMKFHSSFGNFLIFKQFIQNILIDFQTVYIQKILVFLYLICEKKLPLLVLKKNIGRKLLQ